jgi:hypothetical protein
MAFERGHRFSESFETAFPMGLLQMGEVEADREYSDKPGREMPQKIDEATGLRIWKFRATDPGQTKAKHASFEVRLLATHQPVPHGPELMPGMRMVALEGLMVEPKVVGQGEYKSQGYAFWATGFAAAKGGAKTPAGSGTSKGDGGDKAAA